MNRNETIDALARLNLDATVIPEGGLMVPSLRVEVAEEGYPEASWIAEIIVDGKLPWHKGEERRVKLRIMSDEFREDVVKNIKIHNLLVLRGEELVGKLKLLK